jgi:DNA-binding response OmpR family regulator
MSNEQGKQPTIFLIEEEDETRKPLVENLRREGYCVIVAIDEANALERSKAGTFTPL